MDSITVIRWVVGGGITGIGLLILALHCWFFFRGVLLRRHVPSAIPLINALILPFGLLIVPVQRAWQMGVALGLLDIGIGAWVNARRP